MKPGLHHSIYAVLRGARFFLKRLRLGRDFRRMYLWTSLNRSFTARSRQLLILHAEQARTLCIVERRGRVRRLLRGEWSTDTISWSETPFGVRFGAEPRWALPARDAPGEPLNGSKTIRRFGDPRQTRLKTNAKYAFGTSWPRANQDGAKPLGAPAREGRACRTVRRFGNSQSDRLSPPVGSVATRGLFCFLSLGFGLSTLIAEASSVFFRWIA
jgi:hypothetical protein